ncbi:MAG: metallophosphoesterase [Phaeodactylibacter sp.]|nr:metallophosphoesterase [Phaeodactylibacter sp.]
MRIVQLTDLHVGLEGEDTYGVDVRQNFLQILEKVKAETPDLLVISGDLCYHQGDAQIYEWIKGHLDQIDIPYEVMSGNHDDPQLLAKAFSRTSLLKENQLYFSKTYAGRTVLYLDTTTYEIPEVQLKWLSESLQAIDGPALVFMHHPPLQSGVPFMDHKHSLRNMEAVQEIFFQHPHPVQVFTGHYHVEKIVVKHNLTVYITPSCFFQIGQQSEEFAVDHYRIGLRTIDWDNGVMMNAVHYI